MGSLKLEGKARLTTPTVTEGLCERWGRSTSEPRAVEERAETTRSEVMLSSEEVDICA